ncbi:hypothetical protein G6F55_013951 [Rhizopus delemar]|nr:hypothetical protein G6F55_013951 [Rhizopus delemar]
MLICSWVAVPDSAGDHCSSSTSSMLALRPSSARRAYSGGSVVSSPASCTVSTSWRAASFCSSGSPLLRDSSARPIGAVPMMTRLSASLSYTRDASASAGVKTRRSMRCSSHHSRPMISNALSARASR